MASTRRDNIMSGSSLPFTSSMKQSSDMSGDKTEPKTGMSGSYIASAKGSGFFLGGA